MLFSNCTLQNPLNNFNAPFRNVYYNMRMMTSNLIQSRIIQNIEDIMKNNRLWRDENVRLKQYEAL